MNIELSRVLPIEKLANFTFNGGEEWCRNTFQGNWNYNFDYDRLYIEDKREYTMFMLRWA